MKWQEAKALIDEARKLGYKGSDWEKNLIVRLEMLQPAVLLPQDAASVTEYYRRAAGARTFVRHEVIGCKHRYGTFTE